LGTAACVRSAADVNRWERVDMASSTSNVGA
jgi:hypothetical protein